MKTKIFKPIRRLYITAAAFLLGVGGANAYDYTGYNYVEEFPAASGQKGTLGSYIAVQVSDTPDDYLLAFTGTGSGGRSGAFTLTAPGPVAFALKAVVEFDWYPATIGAGAGSVGQITFRKGTADADVLFSVYNLKDRTVLGFTVEPLSGGYQGGLAEATRHELADAPLSAWYHVKAEVDILTYKVSFTVSGITNADYLQTFEIAYPSAINWTGASVANIHFNATRTSGNVSWGTKIDNIGVKQMDILDAQTESITITGPLAVNREQSIDLTASVLPRNSPDSVTWSAKTEDIFSVASTGKLTCRVTAKNTLGVDTVLATSVDGNIVAKYAVTVAKPLVESITIDSDSKLKTLYLPSSATA
jgi:hypothetical protein